uniref:Integrase catalytic domain-containing protein n=1 Tax=Anopheles epiroticus TaxID=199890 RepID=A0A182PWZ2_9DIPT
MIVDDGHRRYRHGSQETVVNEVRQRYDVPSLRSVCKQVRRQCRTCVLLYAQPASPQMCELPAARLAAFCRPFSYTGIDYFGPMIIVNGRKTEKRWGVLFTCLTVRAVHIELVASLSTNDCLMAIRNFMARRGTPIEIVSDRGTNFVGADRELREAAERVDTVILSEFGPPDPVWKFNPPAAPHFGGSWERMIQSVKRMLARIITERHPTEAVLTAALIEVENMLNSRPLTHVPVDGEDEEPLTPNHFLLGSSAGMKPLVKPDDSAAGLRQNWRAVQYKMNDLWKKWVKSYLPTLTRRTKWFEPCKPLQLGDVVLIVDENCPRNFAYAMILTVNGELKRLERKGTITPVDFSSLAAPIVVVRKANDPLVMGLSGSVEITVQG